MTDEIAAEKLPSTDNHPIMKPPISSGKNQRNLLKVSFMSAKIDSIKKLLNV